MRLRELIAAVSAWQSLSYPDYIPCVDGLYNDLNSCAIIAERDFPKWEFKRPKRFNHKALGYCPPPDVSGSCEPEESLAELQKSFIKTLEHVVRNAMQVSLHEVPSSSAVAGLLRQYIRGVESVRLIDCMWRYRKCWAQKPNGVREWWEYRESLCHQLFRSLRAFAPASEIQLHLDLCIPLGPREVSDAITFLRFFWDKFALRASLLQEHPSEDGMQGHNVMYPAETFGPVSMCSWGKPGVAQHLPWSARSNEESFWDMSGFRSRHVSVTAALDQIDRGGVPLSKQTVNIGAGHGGCAVGGPSFDPSNCLFEAGWGGIAVEMSPGEKLLDMVNKRSDVALISQPIYPESAAALLAEITDSNLSDADLFKIDIDSFDCDVVGTLLRVGPMATKPPKLLYIDINPHIPPPFLLRGMSPAAARIVPFQGSSLQCFLDAAKGYELLHVEMYNALLVRRDLVGLFPEPIQQATTLEKWSLGYFCRPDARSLWMRESAIVESCADPRYWADQNQSLSVRGQSILHCLQKIRARSVKRDVQFSLTW